MVWTNPSFLPVCVVRRSGAGEVRAVPRKTALVLVRWFGLVRGLHLSSGVEKLDVPLRLEMWEWGLWHQDQLVSIP